MTSEPGKTLKETLETARRELRAALRREALVVLATGVLLALLVGAAFAARGAARSTLATVEILILIGVVAFAFLRYGFELRRSSDHPEAIASWLDRATGKRGAILDALELQRDAGRFGGSPELTQLAIASAEQGARAIDAKKLVTREAWPALKRKLYGLGVLTAAAVALVIASPALAAKAATALLVRSISEIPLMPLLPEPRLAGFRITYRFPAYAQRSPMMIESPTGDVRALPGTEVVIETRAHEPIASATFVVTYGEGELSGADEEKPEERIVAEVSEASERRVIARMTLSKSGRYRIELKSRDGRDYAQKSGQRIELDPDVPPQVRLLAPTTSPLEVNENDQVDLSFRADDDYGLGEIRVAWRVLGSGREGKQKLSVQTGSSSYRGTAALALKDLNLKPGDRVAYSIEALDNDTVNGPKVGASETKELKVYSKQDHHESVLRLADKALDEVVMVLGDQLERSLGPVESEAAALTLSQATEGGLDRAAKADVTLSEAVAALKKDPLGKKQIAEAFENARKDLKKDARAFGIAFRSSARSPVERVSAADAVRAQERLVVTLEKHSVYLADLLNDTRMLDAEALTKQLRAQQEKLRQALIDYKNAPTEEKKKALEAAIQDIRAQIKEISSKLANMRGSIPEELVSPDALEAKSSEAGLQEVMKKLDGGDLDGALEELDRMLQGTEEMISRMQAGRNELGEREYAQVSETAQQLMDELNDVKAEQKAIGESADKLSQKALERMKNRMGDVKSFIEKQRDRLSDAAKLIEPTQPVAPAMEGDPFEASLRRLDDTGKALDAKDFGAASEVARGARDAVRQMAGELERRVAQARQFGDLFDATEFSEEAIKLLGKAESKVDEVINDLDKLIPPPDQLLTPEERRQMNALGDRQGETEQRAKRVGQLLDRLGEELPIVGEGARKLADDARSAMQRASDAFAKGDSRQASSEHQQAMESIGRLEDALKQMAQNGSGGGGDQPGVALPFGNDEQGEGEGGGRPGDRSNVGNERVEIPKPEQFEAPAAFRQDILEAAKHGAARGYEEAVRRYYEEIVK